MNENGKIYEMGNALCLKWNAACLYVAILVALDSKAEVSKVKQNLAVLKLAMTRKSASWSTGGWHTRNKWQSSPIDMDAGAQMHWKEITHSIIS